MNHVCFSSSAAYSLRQMFQNLGKDKVEQVLHFCDDLTQGPVSDVCGPDRRDFYCERMDEHQWQQQLRFWLLVAKANDNQFVVWMSRRNTLEMTGFSEFLDRIPKEIKFKLADFSNEPMEEKSFFRNVIGTGLLNPKQFECGFEIMQTVCAKNFANDIQVWQQLKLENVELRAFKENVLASVRVDHFDHYLLDCLTNEWQRAARIVGQALSTSVEGGYSMVGDLWLFDRLAVFHDEGRVDCDSATMEPTSKIRLSGNK